MAFKIKKQAPKKEDETLLEGQEEEGATTSGSILEGSVLGTPEQNLPGVQSVDRVVLASENAFDWLEKNRMVVMGSIAAVLVGILAVAGMNASSKKSAVASSQQLYQVHALSAAPTGTDLENDEYFVQGDPSFPNVNARLVGIKDAAQKVQASGKGGASNLAALLSASASLQLGENAAEELAQFDKGASTPLRRAVADFALASNKAANGQLSDALAQLDGLAERIPGLSSVVLEQRASLIEAYGSPQDALVAWNAAADKSSSSELDRRAAKRISLLQLQTGTANTDATDGE